MSNRTDRKQVSIIRMKTRNYKNLGVTLESQYLISLYTTQKIFSIRYLREQTKLNRLLCLCLQPLRLAWLYLCRTPSDDNWFHCTVPKCICKVSFVSFERVCCLFFTIFCFKASIYKILLPANIRYRKVRQNQADNQQEEIKS
jgi:hypothetical protein